MDLQLVRPQPQPQTKVTPTQATLRQSQNTCKCFSKLTLKCFLFLLCCYQRFLVNLSEKAIKQRRPTTMITSITVNNQSKQDGMTVNVGIRGGRRGTICFASSFFLAHLIVLRVFHQALDAQQAERSICSTALCAAWLWHLHRQPWVLQRGRLLSVACSQPSGDSLHLESLSVSGDTKVGIQGGGLNTGGKGRLDVVFRDEGRKPRWQTYLLSNGSVLVC